MDPHTHPKTQAAATELTQYVDSLDGPDLLAELRCLTGTLVQAQSRRDGPMSGGAITAVVLAQALARFDSTAKVAHDPHPGHDDGTCAHHPVASAIPAAEHCRCGSDDGGLKARILAMLTAHDEEAHHTGSDEERIRAMVTERLKDVPGFGGVMVIDVADNTSPEAPGPGMYL